MTKRSKARKRKRLQKKDLASSLVRVRNLRRKASHNYFLEASASHGRKHLALTSHSFTLISPTITLRGQMWKSSRKGWKKTNRSSDSTSLVTTGRLIIEASSSQEFLSLSARIACWLECKTRCKQVSSKTQKPWSCSRARTVGFAKDGQSITLSSSRVRVITNQTTISTNRSSFT